MNTKSLWHYFKNSYLSSQFKIVGITLITVVLVLLTASLIIFGKNQNAEKIASNSGVAVLLPPPVGITPKSISCPVSSPSLQSASATSTPTIDITFDMKSPIYAKADAPIDSVTYKSGDWCAWATGNNDPASGGRCPLPCPGSPTSGYPWTISQDKLSFYSEFDNPYYDNNNSSCTYTVACTGTASVPSITPTPTCPAGSLCVNPPSITPSATPSPTGGVTFPTPTPSPLPGTPSPTPSPTPVRPSATPSPTPSPIPNGSPVPSPTPTVNLSAPGVTIALDIALPGIGENVTKGENNKPRHPTRTITAVLYDGNGNEAGHVAVQVTYNNGDYTGTAHFPGVQSGQYTIKVKSENSLFKSIPGVKTLTIDQTVGMPRTTLVSGDINTDGSSLNILDLSDYNKMLAGFGWSANKSFLYSDLNDDGIIDSKDFNILLRGFATRLGD